MILCVLYQNTVDREFRKGYLKSREVQKVKIFNIKAVIQKLNMDLDSNTLFDKVKGVIQNPILWFIF